MQRREPASECVIQMEMTFALAPQVLAEFIHVVTDQRRFTSPLANRCGSLACTGVVGSGGSEAGLSNRECSEHICRLDGEAPIRAQSSLGHHACRYLF
jgi:hypothetical protein